MSRTKVKGRKMDSNFVSNQIWELTYIARKFAVTIDLVRQAKKTCGKSRRKIYSYIKGDILC